MSQPKPGPWTMREEPYTYMDSDEKEYGYIRRWVEDANGMCVISDEYGIARPDLALMAAAPELLESVTAMLELHGNSCGCGWCLVARHNVAKAKGEGK